MSKDDIDPASVPPVQPNQSGHSSEYAEHGRDPKEGVRFVEKGFFGNQDVERS
jgi:hypothetical protein